MALTATNVQERNKKILDLLEVKEKEGFKYGELGRYLDQLAQEHDVATSTVSSLYYTYVKGKFPQSESEVASNTKQNKEIDPKDNIENIYVINGKEVRVVKDENKSYYVAKDVHDSIGVDRTSPISKDGIKKEYKHYVPVKSSYGYVKTTVYTPEGLQEFLKHVIQKHTNKNITEKAEVFLKHMLNTLNEATVPNTPVTSETEVTQPIVQSEKPIKEESNNIVSFEEESKKIKKPNYKFGDVIDVQVAHIANYGVLVETLDEFGLQGLIYVGDVRHGYVSDLHLYFEVSDKLKAKVKLYDKEKNRLNLSTKDMKLPLKQKRMEVIAQETEDEKNNTNDPLTEQLLKAKSMLKFDESQQVIKPEIEEQLALNVAQPIAQEKPVESKIEEKVETNMGINKVISNTNEEKNTSGLLIEGDREVQKIISVLNGKIGMISPQAREKLLQILNEKGIVDFTMTMMEVLPDFKADLGLMLLGEIDKKLGEYL